MPGNITRPIKHTDSRDTAQRLPQQSLTTPYKQLKQNNAFYNMKAYNEPS